METAASQRVSRSPRCARCRNHGFVVALKGHAGRCRFSQCSCWKCALITARTRIMARQRRIRTSRRAEGRARDAGRTGNRISVPSEVSSDPVSGVTEVPARAADTQDKTYIQLEAAAPSASAAWAPNTDPEIPQKSSDHLKGAQDSAILTAQPHLLWEYFVTEIPQNAVYAGDLAMAMPFHLHAHYANACTHPAFLVNFVVPLPRPIGFPHIPQTPLMESRQEDPGFLYMPYLLQQNPDHDQQYIRERADMFPLQRGRDSGTSN